MVHTHFGISSILLSNAPHATVEQNKLAMDRRCLPGLDSAVCPCPSFPPPTLQPPNHPTTSTQRSLFTSMQAHVDAGTNTCSCCDTGSGTAPTPKQTIPSPSHTRTKLILLAFESSSAKAGCTGLCGPGPTSNKAPPLQQAVCVKVPNKISIF